MSGRIGEHAQGGAVVKDVDDTAVGSLKSTGDGAAGSGAFDRGDDLPATIGRYRVLMPLGSGATGVVVSAFDPDLDRKLALKILHGGHDNDATRRRLFREAQALARVSHPNVVEVFHVGSEDGRVYIATELIEGVSLWRWLRQRQRTAQEIIKAFVAAGRGLAAAHEVGIVHRDFKPANALIARDGRVVVIDFGIAHAVGPTEFHDGTEGSTDFSAHSSALNRTAGLSGTPSYMAPEQFARLPADARSDQFSFCVALWESLYGTRPYPGETAETISRAVLAGELHPPPPDHLVPPAVERLLSRGLQVDPSDRYPTMDPLLDALDRVRDRRWWRIAAGTALILSAAAFGVSSMRDARQGQCEAARDELADVWSEDSRSRLEQGLVAAGASTAETSERLMNALDDYAARWVDLHDTTCNSNQPAGDARGHSDPCLDERLAAFAELVHVLEDGSGPSADKGLQAVLELPALGECSQPREPTRAGTVPTEEDRAIRRLIGRSMARRAVGDNAGAIALLDFDADPILATPSTRSRARIELERGQSLAPLRRRDEAMDTFEHAHQLAMKAGDDETAADAAVQLMGLYADVPPNIERALEWGRLAEALLDRTEEADRVYLYLGYGVVYWRAGQTDQALQHLELAQEAFEPDFHSLPLRAQIHQLAGVLFDTKGMSGRAIEELEASLRIERQAYGPRHPLVATVHNNLAAVLVGHARLSEAEHHLQQAVETWDALGGSYQGPAGAAWNNLGVVQGRLGRYSDALASYQRAMENMRRVQLEGDVDLARPQANIADILVLQGRYDEAETLRRSVLDRLQEALGPNDSHTLITREALGTQLIGRGRTEEGLAMLADVVAVRERSKSDDPTNLAHALWAWGEGLHRAGEHKRALKVLQRASDLQQTLDDYGSVSVRINGALAAAHLATGNVVDGSRYDETFRARFDDLPWDEGAESGLLVARAWQAADRVDDGLALLQQVESRLPEVPIADHWRDRLARARAELGGIPPVARVVP